jgi:hypothetical protein
MMTRLAAASTIALMSGSVAFAEDIEIVCTLSEVMDKNAGDMEQDTGSVTFVISRHADGSMTYKVPFHCMEGTLVASVTDAQMTFGCDDQIGAVLAENHATIDRASGEYVNGFGFKGMGAGVVHFGTCDLSAVDF